MRRSPPRSRRSRGTHSSPRCPYHRRESLGYSERPLAVPLGAERGGEIMEAAPQVGATGAEGRAGATQAAGVMPEASWTILTSHKRAGWPSTRACSLLKLGEDSEKQKNTKHGSMQAQLSDACVISSP